MNRIRHTFALFSLFMVSACGGQNDDPSGASSLWSKLASENYTSWQRAPGYPTRMSSHTAHADSVEIFVNPVVATALTSSTPLTEWPLGSVVAKRGYKGTSLHIVAAMEKRSDGWFWAEYDKSGDPLFSGKPDVCVDCHSARATYSDYTFSFEFPR